MTPPVNEMGTNQLKGEIMRLSVENAALLAALERAESDLDVALERVRAAIAKVAPKAEAKNPLDDWE